MNNLYLLPIIGLSAIILIAGMAYQYQFAHGFELPCIYNCGPSAEEKQRLQEEYDTKFRDYLRESAIKCQKYQNPNNLTEFTPLYNECSDTLQEKYGIFDKKYDVIDTQKEFYRIGDCISKGINPEDCV